LTRPTLKPKLSGNKVTLDLGGIQDGEHPLSFVAEGAELALDGEGERLFREFAFEGSLMRAGEHIEIRGSLTGLLETACDRCLERFDREMRAQLEVRALCGGGGANGDAPEGVVRLAPGATELDLTGHLREAALLEIPIKNLCREECRGLCSRCGVNRNREVCECDPPAGDSRWDALRELGSSPAVTKKEE
jgi:uncharacterized protein